MYGGLRDDLLRSGPDQSCTQGEIHSPLHIDQIMGLCPCRLSCTQDGIPLCELAVPTLPVSDPPHTLCAGFSGLL